MPPTSGPPTAPAWKAIELSAIALGSSALIVTAYFHAGPALLLWMARYFWRLSRAPEEQNERQQFVTKIAAGIHFIAALATLFVGIPLLQIPPCL